MSTKKPRLLLTIAMVAIGATMAVQAAEGRVPIWQAIVITPGPGPGFHEGAYVVTRDIVGIPGVPVIDVQPNTVAVEIDLNGFTLYGNASDVIRAVGVDSLTVRNGTIMGGINSILAIQGRKVVVEDVKMQFPQVTGISLNEVATFGLRRNIIVRAQSEGILADDATFDPTTTTSGTIEGNIIRECGRGIALYNGSAVAITNNRIDTTTVSDGIFVSPGPGGIIGCGACLIAENTIEEASANGMWLSAFRSGQIKTNQVISSGFNQGGQGIWLDLGSDWNLVRDNVAGMNGANGLLVFSFGNHIETNLLNGNGASLPPGWGLRINGGNNTYRGNTAMFNTGLAGACPISTTDFCDFGPANVSPFRQGALMGDNQMPGLL